MPTPAIRAILFDYGLVLSGPPHPEAWETMQRLTGLSPTMLDTAYWAQRRDYDSGVLTAQQYWYRTGAVAGLEFTAGQVEELIAADNQLWTQPNPPMIAWVHRLHAAGTPTGILSNLGDAMTAGVLTAFPWMHNFSHLLFSHTVRLTKPDAAIYRHAAEGLATPASDILFIDDREENIAGAVSIGMQTIQYTTQPEFEQELRGRGLETLWTNGHL